jgi:hypothetical protein
MFFPDPNLDFFFSSRIPDPGVKKGIRSGSRMPVLDPQRCNRALTIAKKTTVLGGVAVIDCINKSVNP